MTVDGALIGGGKGGLYLNWSRWDVEEIRIGNVKRR
jgi:hypothetical protein